VCETSPGPHSSPGYWLHHAALAWRQVCEAGLGDVTYPQFNILSAVSLVGAADGPPTQQQAADFARMDRMMASKVISALEAKGLLTRSADAADARRRRLTLTTAGREALRRCVAAARSADEQVFGILTEPGEVATLRSALRRIVEGGTASES
jgi:DNA-binding MarR family transcriptional regulator